MEIKKFQYGGEAASTYVQKPFIPIRFPRRITRPPLAELRADNRSSWERKQGELKAEQARKDYYKLQLDLKSQEGFDRLMRIITPSTYVEGITGLNLGPVGRLAVDMLIPSAAGVSRRLLTTTDKSAFRNMRTRVVANEMNRTFDKGIRTTPEKTVGLTLTVTPSTQETHPWLLFNSQYSRWLQPNGKVRLQLNSHTESRPRLFVLDPQDNNKYYVHMRTWNGDKVPANMSSAEKNTLYEALYNELPDGAEILFPQSGPGFYGTRGTVAGLQRLSRDGRFTPGTPGTLLYIDKDGSVLTYNGTSFIKSRPNRSITFMLPFPEVPPRLQPYILAARRAKEQNIQNLAQQAKDYANSPLRKALDLQLNLEAHDLGFLGNNESLQFMLPNNKPPKIQIHDEQIPGENAGVNGNYVDATNTINLTGASAQGFTPFHEHLHYYGIGSNPIITLTRLGRLFYNVQPDGTHGKPLIETDAVFNLEGTRKRSGYYREHKLDEVLNPEEMQKLKADDYEYIRSEELPVHGLTTGKELGIEPFSPYPGDAAMPEIVNKAVAKNPWLRVVKSSNSSELLNFWKLLTGSYLGLNAPLIFRYNEEK